MGLFKPAYFSKKPAKRDAALDKLPEAQLKELLLGDLSSYSKNAKEQQDFRWSCLSRIHDDQFLAQLVVSLDDKQGTSPFISTAIANIRDDRLLYALLKQCKLGRVRSETEQQLHSPEILCAVALDASMSDSLRIRALETLNDPVISAQIAKANGSVFLRRSAARFLDKNDAPLADELAEKYLSGRESCVELGMFGFRNCKSSEIKQQLMQGLLTFQDQRLKGAAMGGFSEDMLLEICSDKEKEQLHHDAVMQMENTHSLWNLLNGGSENLLDTVFIRLADIGSERDVPRLVERIDDEKQLEHIVHCISRIEKCSHEDVLAKYGTEKTAEYYFSSLNNNMGTGKEKYDIIALKALYRAGKGKPIIEPMRGKTLHGHIDERHSSCTPGWGHGDIHDDIPALRFDL